jgi:mannose-6-phosphate isomerase-like protein (cupin superfamily)
MTISNVHNVKEWFEVLQTTERTQTAVMVLTAGGHSSEETNTHERSDQVLLLLEGELQAEIGGEKRIMRKGDTCIVSAGIPHRFENRGKSRAVTFNVYSPPEYSPEEKG